MTKTLIATADPEEEFLWEQIAKGLRELLKVRSRWHPLYRIAHEDLDAEQRRCPFAHETSRGVGELEPCPTRYIATCGCHRDGVPSRRAHWTRSNA